MLVFIKLTASDEFQKWNINVFSNLTGLFVTFLVFARARLADAFSACEAIHFARMGADFAACGAIISILFSMMVG